MQWKQLGIVYATQGTHSWSQSHVQAPTAMEINGRIRVYFGTRNADNRSLTSFIEVDRADPTRVLYVHDRPVMDFGLPGTHDEDGVIASHVIPVGNELWMYYGGVSRGGTVPYRMSIGLAVSQDGGASFQRMFDGPVIDRTPSEPYMTMAPYVIREGGRWTVWYGSGIRWISINEKYEPIYVIKTATSEDGITWDRSNHQCIQPLHELEANTRPSVLKTASGYEMWFSYRSSENYRDGSGSYRIGHALSVDGKNWVRQQDPEGLSPAGTGWNSHTMSYPSVIVVDGRKLMFHNGDGFGKSGLGCAVFGESL